jgi:hypothetical protein
MQSVHHGRSALLPFHFAISRLASAVSVLQFTRHGNSRALHALGIGAAAAETLVGGCIELKTTPACRPLKHGTSGWMTRVGGVLAGPLPLPLRLLAGRGNGSRSRKLQKAAAVSAIAGPALLRFAWVKAGHGAPADPNSVLSNPMGKAIRSSPVNAVGSIPPVRLPADVGVLSLDPSG